MVSGPFQFAVATCQQAWPCWCFGHYSRSTRPRYLPTNIQISELNALNACLAVIRFKQLRGFYFEEVPYYHLVMEVGDLKTAGEFDLSED